LRRFGVCRLLANTFFIVLKLKQGRGGTTMLTGIKTIVFDLDGTLYEETNHFDYYADRVAGKLPSSKREEFIHDYQTVLDGRHVLQIGKVYDANRDVILTVKDGNVLKAERWDGSKLTNDEILAYYSEAIEVNLDDMLSIGDLWWIPVSLGRHYGLSQEETYEAFLQTREYMMSPKFQMNPIRGLKETLHHLSKRRVLIMMTNSPRSDSEAILAKLKLENVFHEKIFMAGKPVQSKQQFHRISGKFGVQFHEILSIGDNYVNDILPAKELGCQTMMIDQHHVAPHHSADVIVKSLADGIPILQSL